MLGTIPQGRKTYLDQNGTPLAGGMVSYYVPGTTTPVVTYLDDIGTTPNTQPIVLDSAGSMVAFAQTGQYREYVKDADGNLISDTEVSMTPTISAAMEPVVEAATTDAALGALGLSPVGVQWVKLPSKAAMAAFLELQQGNFNAKTFGATGDGVTDDSAAIQAALDASAAAGGGIVYLPPTGKPYLINTGLQVKNGTTLRGSGARGFAGPSGTVAQYAADGGSWLHCTDMVNPAIRFPSGHGVGVEGLNIAYTQPTPTSAAYVPTQFPFAIATSAAQLVTIDNVFILGAYRGISFNYGTAGGRLGSYVTNTFISTLRVGMQVIGLADTLIIDGLTIENMWYAQDPTVTDYIQTNMVGLEVGYCDNANWSDIQIFQAKYAMTLTDTTANGITHSLFNSMIDKFQVNLCGRAISLTNFTTSVSAQFTNCVFQNFPPWSGVLETSMLFDLISDNVDISISNSKIFAGAGAFLLGQGGLGDNRTGIPGASLMVSNCRIWFNQRGTNPGALLNLNPNSNAWFSNNLVFGTGTLWGGGGLAHGIAAPTQLPTFATDPVVLFEGQIWQNTTDHKLKVFQAGAIQVLAVTLPPGSPVQIPVLAADPVAPPEGSIWENSSTQTIKVMQAGLVKTVTVV